MDSGHLSDDDLERYALGTVKDEATRAILEEHLLVCGPCIDRAQNIERQFEDMRAALKRLEAERKGG